MKETLARACECQGGRRLRTLKRPSAPSFKDRPAKIFYGKSKQKRITDARIIISERAIGYPRMKRYDKPL